jgi:hypothetical protein
MLSIPETIMYEKQHPIYALGHFNVFRYVRRRYPVTYISDDDEDQHPAESNGAVQNTVERATGESNGTVQNNVKRAGEFVSNTNAPAIRKCRIKKRKIF